MISNIIISPIIEIIRSINPKFQDWYDHLGPHDKSSFGSELTQGIFSVLHKEMGKRTQRWPAKGEKLKAARAINHHWFSDVIENSKKLELGKFYTVKLCEPVSSWCPVEIEEMDGTFCLSSFEWKC